MPVQAFDWWNVGIGVLLGIGAALAALGVLLAALNRRVPIDREDRPEP